MLGPEKKLPAAFYGTPGGKEPVRAWLKDLSPKNRRIVGIDIATVEYDWPVGMPLCRSLGDGLWEVRSTLADGRISRVVFCTVKGRMVLLHGFIKKSRKTPDKDRHLALKRKKEIEE